ncbi:von Willebrand factor type A domain protein [Ceratocystis platani]|uniref:von Willebrand factor type A domain protein n=1 Tax=Ceratocystis fimbriata f. sp. platani TaxID=88771 RepID=A0A0F8DAU0_CERFI|nr:von Willebrand factor type A domain protein [Ceratocystis platani]
MGEDQPVGSHQEPPPPYSSPTNYSLGSPGTPDLAASTPRASLKEIEARRIPATSTDDDPYAFLSSFDTVFVIDDSGSMYGSNWAETQEVLKAIMPICTSHDADGIDLYFLNYKSKNAAPCETKGPNGFYSIKSPAEIQKIFDSINPYGTTPTGQRLQSILAPYQRSLVEQSKKKGALAEPIKPINIITITDGRPSDDVEGVIVPVARRLDSLDASPYQVGLQFFQVGSDANATAGLRELDDGLEEMNIRDIVDTVSWDGELGTGLSSDLILKTVLGAVNRRLDRKRCDTPPARDSLVRAQE